jgi:uncharacterized membrane protein
LQHLPKAAVPEIAIATGATLQVPLVLHNNTSSAKQITLSLTVPEGWSDEVGTGSYTVPAGDEVPVLMTVTAPKAESKAVDEITCHAESDGQSVGVIKLHVKRRSGGLPQN